MRKFCWPPRRLARSPTVPTLASAQFYAADIYPGAGRRRGQSAGRRRRADGRRAMSILRPDQVYVAPGTQYQDQAIIIEGRRYYRDCWWDWGQRRCELKPWF